MVGLKKVFSSLILVISLVVMTGCAQSVSGSLSKSGEVKKEKPENGFIAYKVKSGDTPSKIAKKYKMDLRKFLLINNLTETSTIHPGQQLYIERSNELRQRFLSY